MLRESQNFFFHLMAHPEVIGQLRKNRAQILKRFFRSQKDRQVLRGVPLERLQTYRDHVSMGLLGGIASAFPVLRSLLSHEEWTGLLNDFYLKRLTRSPIARHVYREFSHYLQKRYRGPLLKRLPYLKELAEYENLDLRLFYDVDRPTAALRRDGPSAAANAEEFLRLVPVLNPHHALRVYRWPVHQIGQGHSSLKQVRSGRYPLLIYRDPESLKIRFLEANRLVADLVGRMQSGRQAASRGTALANARKGSQSLGRILEGLLRQQKSGDSSLFVREGVSVIQYLRDQGVVLGFRKMRR